MTANDSAPGGRPGARGDQRGARSTAMVPRTTDKPLRSRRATTSGTPAADRETLLARYRQERARRTLVLGSIREHLEEQPSVRSIRTAGRRWTEEITNLTNAVAADRKTREDDQ